MISAVQADLIQLVPGYEGARQAGSAHSLEEGIMDNCAAHEHRQRSGSRAERRGTGSAEIGGEMPGWRFSPALQFLPGGAHAQWRARSVGYSVLVGLAKQSSRALDTPNPRPPYWALESRTSPE